MTAATAAQPNGNALAVLLCMFLLVSAITCVGWWIFERRGDRQDERMGRQDQQLATLAGRIQSLADFLGVDINDPVDDSPAALAEEPDTEEFPAYPATEPDGIALQVQSALLARDLSGEFPHPVDSAERKAKNAADIEERLKQFNFTGRSR